MKSKLQNILFWLLSGLMAFILLYPKFPLLNVPGTYVAIRLEDFFIAILISFWGIYTFKYNIETFNSKSFKIFLLFWFIGFISLLSAFTITHSVAVHLGILHWIRRIEFMLFFLIAATTIISKQQIRYLFLIFFIVTCFILFYGFGQLFLGFKVVSTIDKDFSTGIISTLSPGGRVNSTFAGHYDLAIYLSFIMIILTGAFFYVKEFWIKASIIILGVLCFLLQGYAASRISFFAAIAGIIVVLFLLKKKILVLWILILSVIIVMLIPQFRERMIATVNVYLSNKVEKSYTPTNAELENKNIEQIVKEKSEKGLPIDIAAGESTDYTELEVGRSTSIRLTDEWPRALNAFYINPLLGTGYSSISLATDNDYFRALGETGILGLVTLFIIFYIITINIINNLKTSDHFNKILFIITLAIIVDMMITAIFIDVFEASKIAILFWFLLGLAWGQIRLKT